MNLFGSAAPGFDQPLGMLRACHERILRQCDTLVKLAAHIKTHGVDDDATTAAAQVHRYFSPAGQHHHADEEEDLFPLLRANGELAALIAGLQQDHQAMEKEWAALEPLLAKPQSLAMLPDFAQRAQAFRALYARHIDMENDRLLPLAGAFLSADQLAGLGACMARRRGVDLDEAAE
jgi:hemerythrin-like domain-containing protein